MRIAVFHNLPAGGAKRVLFEQVKRLSSRHKIYLFELASKDNDFLDPRRFCDERKVYKVELISKLPSFLNRLHKDWKNFFSLKQIHKVIAQEIDKESCDVCLVHPDRFTQAPFLLRFLKTPSVYYCHELLRIAYEKELRFDEKVSFMKKIYENLTRLYRKEIDKENVRFADRVLTNSYYIKRKVEYFYKVKASVCRPGVDTDVFRPFAKKKRRVLFLGSDQKIDGHDLIEKVVDSLKKRISFEFRHLAFSKKISDRQLAKEYSQSILTLCTSRNEPFGLIPLESMACETPVLALDEGGYRETIINGKTGFLLGRNEREFSEKIEYLLNNPNIARKMGEFARSYVIKNFNWDKHISFLENKLVELI